MTESVATKIEIYIVTFTFKSCHIIQVAKRLQLHFKIFIFRTDLIITFWCFILSFLHQRTKNIITLGYPKSKSTKKALKKNSRKIFSVSTKPIRNSIIFFWLMSIGFVFAIFGLEEWIKNESWITAACYLYLHWNLLHLCGSSTAAQFLDC